ncbi:MAG: malto-oligosyltrehalose synthase [Proteobacteria bacterium]|nr:MAG: malto-oligosyltrehalose synthase [Pseudomonadota bacterium]
MDGGLDLGAKVSASGELTRLAAAYGIQPLWHDIWGNVHHVPETTQRRLLVAMQVAASNDEEVRESLLEQQRALWSRVLSSTVVAYESELPLRCTLRLPAVTRGQPLIWRLIEESGAHASATIEPSELRELEQFELGGVRFFRCELALPFKPPSGYHRLSLASAGKPLGESLLIVAPDRCYEPAAVEGDGRTWGPAVQLYSVRSSRNWGIGDFTDLRLILEQWNQRGAGMVAVNPLHALFPHNPAHASPYSPSSRLFLNPLYLDPERMDDFRDSDEVQRHVASAEFQARLRDLRTADLVDYHAVAGVKMQVLAMLYMSFRRRHLQTGSERAGRFREFQARSGIALRRHALFEALQEHFHARDPAVWGWPVWPQSYRDPASPTVDDFAQSNGERVEFFEWLQWQADEQLAGIGLRALELHSGVGLYGDLAVSIDRGGAEAWANQDVYALDAEVGAPPDDFSLNGQNWGLPPFIPHQLQQGQFAPFIATLRANMQHTGALRIDHVMGLMRLFWIPSGVAASEGAYVSYPLRELLAILALESHRSKCLIIGEDLGTVPDEVRHSLAERHAFSYRLLYFARKPGGEFLPPAEYPALALVAATTHDLPTLAGFWDGRDLALRTQLGLFPSDEMRQRQSLERAQDRARLLIALEREQLLPPGVALDPASVPSMTPELARALHVYLARTPCKVLAVQLEDVLGMTDQVNLPGTTDRYPNWRRKISLDLERWPEESRFVSLCEQLAQARPRPVPAPAATSGPRARIPRATYRLQLNRSFTFAQATELVPYLAQLGVSHVYCSPYLRARPGSTHGYDIIDHNALNPEIGSTEDFERFVAELRRHGIWQLIDLVPNHMGVLGADNAWWMDVLENGRASIYRDFFDIDWEPANPELQGKVLVPVLGDHYGAALARGELSLQFDPGSGSLSVYYFEHRFPVDPREYPRVLQGALNATLPPAVDESVHAEFQSLITAFSYLPSRDQVHGAQVRERNRDKELHKRQLARMCRDHPALGDALQTAVKVFNGSPGQPPTFDPLHELLEAQPYRLAYWRVASDEINYRRFFDINDLAALRMENDAVFEATHRFVLELVASGKVDGLRVDHPDGLYLPARYFQRLQQRVATLTGADATLPADKEQLPVYLAIEKITAGHERVPDSWPVHGTTGYRFANVVNGLFVDPTARSKMDRIYRAFVPEVGDFERQVYEAKQLVLRTGLASERTVLANQLTRIAQADRSTRDFTFDTLRRALSEVIACFPVYRTYIDDRVGEQDRRFIEWAVARAKRYSRAADVTVFDFVRATLLAQPADPNNPWLAEQAFAFARKFQQLTAPVTAKGIEDTAFYRYNRLVSLNEVGGNPAQFGFSVAAFHGATQDRAARWPFTMLATSTHDSKRSEDLRVRIDVLSEMPAGWRLSVRRWSRINRNKKRRLGDGAAPSANDEYLLYQTLVGSWPHEPLDEPGLASYRDRIQAYMLKAVREAKVHSSWVNVNTDYERALADFINALLGRLTDNLFLEDFLPTQRYIAWLGMLNGLSQVAIKLASPGVVDIFQGNEIWDLSLVDPDNRRPVDYVLRRALLDQVRDIANREAPARSKALRGLLVEPVEGRSKLYITFCGLQLRRDRETLFKHGSYTPLAAEGRQASHLVAFARRSENASGIILIAPRLLASLVPQAGYLPLGEQTWEDTVVVLPWAERGCRMRHVYTGAIVTLHEDGRGPHLPVRELLSDFPVALIEYDTL